MFDFRTAFLLITRAFSFRRGDLRFPWPKRVFFIFVLLPLFFIHILICHLFLLLDDLIFPRYKRMDISHSLFVVGMPRSGTSFLLNLICDNKESFTAFSFGESMFAPSILQKYFYRALSVADTGIGSPLKRILRIVEKPIFRFTAGVHDISFFGPEEDEFLFLYTFQSLYLHFIFPGLEQKHSLLNRDELINTKAGKRMMDFYINCVKRHQYVFNRDGKKIYVSKNPAYPGMINLLFSHFPSAYYIDPYRKQHETVSSTLSLNAHLYSGACRVPTGVPFKEKTILLLLKWDTKMRTFAQSNNTNPKFLQLKFEELTEQPLITMQKIHSLVGKKMNENARSAYILKESKTKKYNSPHSYSRITEEELVEFQYIHSS